MARGPDAVRSALVEAAADGYAEEAAPSVRRIAARAGVNHGLVHHYFGGKGPLRRAVLEHLASQLDASLHEVADDDLVAAALEATANDGRFMRVLARTLLDEKGEVPEELQRSFPVVRRLESALAATGEQDPRATMAAGLSTAFGWMLFGPWIRAALDLTEEEADAVLRDALTG